MDQTITITSSDTIRLINAACSRCHLIPNTNLLTKDIWKKVIDNMCRRLGYSAAGYDPFANLDQIEQLLLQQTGVYPDKPQINEAQYLSILNYFQSKAPDSFSFAQDKIAPLNDFEMIPLGHFIDYPGITYLHWNSHTKLVEVCLETGAIISLNVLKGPVNTLKLDNIPIQVVNDQKGQQFIVCIGNMYPSEQKSGTLIRIDGQKKTSTLLRDLHRPVNLLIENEKLIGDQPVIISEFGFESGALNSYHFHDDQGSLKQTILSQPGAVKAFWRDLNIDGNQELIVLMSQAMERIVLFEKRGTQLNELKTLMHFTPVQGVCDLDLMDMNSDGLEDLIVSNGDNADYSYSIKPYHGIRIYLNQGNFEFIESQFIPYPGILHADIRDYDQDGDVDIAAVSFFPGDKNHPIASFKLFKNESGRYIPHSFPASAFGRWMSILSEDVDLDGDKDILLGSYILDPQKAIGTKEQMKQHALIWLRNRLIK